MCWFSSSYIPSALFPTLATHTKWKWAGHVMRMGQNRWAHKTTTWDPRTSHRNVGRQKRRWADDLKLHFGSNWTTKAKDRRHWKDLTAAASVKEDWRPAKSQTTRDGQNIQLTQKQQRLEEDPSRIGYVGPPDQSPCQPRGPCPQGYLHGLNLNSPYYVVEINRNILNGHCKCFGQIDQNLKLLACGKNVITNDVSKKTNRSSVKKIFKPLQFH